MYYYWPVGEEEAVHKILVARNKIVALVDHAKETGIEKEILRGMFDDYLRTWRDGSQVKLAEKTAETGGAGISQRKNYGSKCATAAMGRGEIRAVGW